MALDSADLVQYARESADRGDDLFALLGVDATTPKEDIHRAWRRAGLKYHPDKAGADFDPAKYESFERARDVLCDPAAREAYDNAVRAVLQKKRRAEEMSAGRRRFVDELEQAEREAKRPRTDTGGGLTPAERHRIAEAGRKKMEERARRKQEAEARSRQRGDDENSSTPAETAAPTGQPSRDGQAPRTPTVPSAPAEAQTEDVHGGDRADDNGSEYDERIAELERRLKEKQEKKAARKADKKSRKSDVSSLSSGLAATAPTPAKGSDDITDGEKVPEPKAFSFKPFASAPSSPATKSSGNSLPQFATTMARLKAAQAKREEEKRRRGEASSELAT